MAAELIVTERCRGLYKTDAGTVAHCEHPISHSPPECGPDPIARPYVKSPAPVPAPTVKPSAEPLVQRVTAYLTGRNNYNNFAGRPVRGKVVHPIVAAALLAFAALHDERDGPVQDEEISRVLGNAASTVRRHLKEHHTIARHVGKGWFAPVD